jgi:hypothetical protein
MDKTNTMEQRMLKKHKICQYFGREIVVNNGMEPEKNCRNSKNRLLSNGNEQKRSGNKNAPYKRIIKLQSYV